MSNGMERKFREEIEFYAWACANKPWGVPMRLWWWFCKIGARWDK